MRASDLNATITPSFHLLLMQSEVSRAFSRTGTVGVNALLSQAAGPPVLRGQGYTGGIRRSTSSLEAKMSFYELITSWSSSFFSGLFPAAHPAFTPPLSLLSLSTYRAVLTVWGVLLTSYTLYRLYVFRGKNYRMALSPFVVLNVFLLAIFACLSPFVTGHPGPIDARQYTTTTTTTISSSTSSSATYSSSGSQFTVPSNYQNGQTLLPNIMDPQAKNPQSVCPGYTASSVTQTQHGITAKLSLAGAACNVYGNDVADLTLTVEFQAEDRLHVEITPTYVGSQNSTWFVLPPQLVPKPTIDPGYTSAALGSDLDFVWSNDPSFSFTVRRYSTGDVLFSTVGSKLVFEDQFIEFVTSMPENYNVYGLGEVIHPLRLGNNLTRTIWAADVGDPPNYNLYGSHPMYLDTRYFSVDEKTGAQTYVANATDTTASYKSYSHGVFLRNAHGQEILLQPSNITWRTIGGNIDLYFYAGPSQYDVMKTYQTSTVGLPAMQQYFAFGYHQCRWGYANWSQLQDVVDNFAKFSLPLDTIWTDID